MGRLVKFCRELDSIASEQLAPGEAGAKAAEAMAELLKDDEWLPDPWAAPSAERYQQHLLYLDPKARFSVVSFVWGPGQHTPIHNHGGLWGVVGILCGLERSTRYTLTDDGRLIECAPEFLRAGTVEVLDPTKGDIHAVANALPDKVSISIHAYGGDIGSIERQTFEPHGMPKIFVSRYSSQPALIEALN